MSAAIAKPPPRKPFARKSPLSVSRVTSGESLLTLDECSERLGKSSRWLEARAKYYGFQVGGEWRFHWPSVIENLKEKSAHAA